jgi:hypothetical protein
MVMSEICSTEIITVVYLFTSSPKLQSILEREGGKWPEVAVSTLGQHALEKLDAGITPGMFCF